MSALTGVRNPTRRAVRPRRRWLGRAAATAGVGLLLLAGGAVLWLRTSLPQVSGELRVAGLAAPVEIVRDRRAVPHIRAATLGDAYFALGFVHAQDRLFQMDLARRVGAGRLAEVLGPRAVASDRAMRLIGIGRLAESSLAALAPEVQAGLAAYAAGVNAHLEVHAGALAPEFVALSYRPEPWRPADSLVWPRLMALQLSGNWRAEALRGRLAPLLTPEQLDDLFPREDEGAPPTISSDFQTAPADGLARRDEPPLPSPLAGEGGERSEPGEGLPAAAGKEESRAQTRFPSPLNRFAVQSSPARGEGELDRLLDRLLAAMPRELVPVTASNSWAVAGAHTATGKPVLANDPHLGYRAPGLWYLARIETPDLTLVGATVPGIPATLLGHNGRIAWAFTTTESDTQDLYVERLDPADPGRYLAPGGSRPFETRTEVIRVKDAPPVTLVVRATRHGPVVSDLPELLRDPAAAGVAPGHVVALAAAALLPDDTTAEALHRLNRARDWGEFRAALRFWHGPQQNITYADAAGNVGFIAPARVPIRRAGDGSAPAPGWTGERDWTGFIPFDELPQAFNPAHGRIVNANHRIVGDGYPYFLGHVDTPPYRARRIHELLDAAPRLAPEDAARMLMDAVSPMARELLPPMLEVAPREARTRAAIALLEAWDGTMRRDRPEPLVFTAWLRELARALYADETGALFRQLWDVRPTLVKRALATRPEWCDDVATPARETCAEVVGLALRRALDGLEAEHGADPAAWRWGDAHVARFAHPVFGFVPLVRPLANIVIAVDGGAYTVNRAQYDIASDRTPFAAVHGPGYRAVYDLADLDRSLFTQATGQSGNPLSPHYRDLTTPWRDGEFFRIAGGAGRAGAAGALRLAPRRTPGERERP